MEKEREKNQKRNLSADRMSFGRMDLDSHTAGTGCTIYDDPSAWHGTESVCGSDGESVENKRSGKVCGDIAADGRRKQFPECTVQRRTGRGFQHCFSGIWDAVLFPVGI